MASSDYSKRFGKICGYYRSLSRNVFGRSLGYSVLQDVTQKFPSLPAPEIQALVIGGIAGSVSIVVILGLVRPESCHLHCPLLVVSAPSKKVQAQVQHFTTAVTAYRGKVGLLLLVFLNKFRLFTNRFVVYFYGLGYRCNNSFWPIVFGSNIQILGTLFSPTIAGEGVREAIQAFIARQTTWRRSCV